MLDAGEKEAKALGGVGLYELELASRVGEA
jgi:hypothetical protein